MCSPVNSRTKPYRHTDAVPIYLSEREWDLRGAQPGAAERAMMVDRQTISIMKACELVGVSRRTIYNWIASGKVEYVRTAGGSVRIFVDTLWREPGRTHDHTRKEDLTTK